MGFPSSKNIKLSLGANGAKYLAPANGWFAGNFLCSKKDSWFVLEVKATHTKCFSTARGTNTEVYSLLPVVKGDIVTLGVDPTATYTTDDLRPGFYFIYANGED